MRLVLASRSPRRAELLRAAGFTFDTVVTSVDERTRAGESPALYVRRLAAEKSAAGHAAYAMFAFPSAALRASRRTFDGPAKAGHYVPDDVPDDVVILGADTTVVVDGAILGKPRDAADAARMLRQLSGRRHEVMTGLSLRRGAFEVGRVETSAVFFSLLSDDDVTWYVASGEGRDKAGAYAIQGLASRFITRIEGSYTNVVGLPVACLVELLTEIRRRNPERP